MVGGAAPVAGRADAGTSEPPSDAECPTLPPIKGPLAFTAGEQLEFEMDALGALAGRLRMRVLPQKDGTLPVEASVQTSTFFSKIRRVKGLATSYLNPKTLRPTRYVEDSVESSVHKYADVAFRPKEHAIRVEYKIDDRPGQAVFRYANEGLDPAGTIYLLRQLPLKAGTKVCFDIYGIRRLWRLWGKVEGKEHLSLALGEFDAWHLSGQAVRLDDHRQRREIHVWVSDDHRRLPVVAVGAIDLGAVRATLISYLRPGEKPRRAEGKETLKW
jgi:hypothetical protein